MSFFDIDEYLVPVQNDTWGPLLEEKGNKSPVLGIRESRTLPRFELTDNSSDEAVCTSAKDMDTSGKDDESAMSCLVPRTNETYLSIYNCDIVKPPRPKGYFRNMKQIYRPDFVLSHFVHYSAITRPIAEYYKDKIDARKYRRAPSQQEKYVSKSHPIDLRSQILLSNAA